MSAFDGGHLQIVLACESGRIVRADVAVRGRPEVAKALRGKTVDEVQSLLPLLFAVCGKAQGRAAALAIAAARGVETEPCLDAAVEAEVLREHLWRLLLDLPPLLGLSPRKDIFLAAVPHLNDAGRSAVARQMADPFWNEWMAALADIDEPDETGGLLLPLLSAAGTLTAWPRLNEALARAPRWDGEPAETGAYARWQGQNPAGAAPFAARWHARCAEVWSWSSGGAKVGAGGTVSAASVAPGVGRALVETARGLLMHEVAVEGDRIADYVIVAPTEWNFHPHGVLSDWLSGRPCGDRMAVRRFVAHAVAALDPCVRWELEWA